MKTTLVTIRGVNGQGAFAFPADQWSAMAPVTRVLALHGALRSVTAGKPFDVLSVKTEG